MPKKLDVYIGDVVSTNKGGVCEVVKISGARDIIVEFLDEYKHRVKVTAQQIREGTIGNPYHPSIYGVGFHGIGKYTATIGGKTTSSYQTWSNMMLRCYDETKRETAPSYKDVTVCEEWHCYQNFAEWYENHRFYGRGYQLDKDILIEGNRVYRPEACTLVPRQLNNLLTDSAATRGEYKIGVTYHKVEGAFRARVSVKGVSKFIGRYNTEDEAHKAYIVEKKRYLRDMAIEYHGKIEPKVFESLIIRSGN